MKREIRISSLDILNYKGIQENVLLRIASERGLPCVGLIEIDWSKVVEVMQCYDVETMEHVFKWEGKDD